jgi:hypothetical protein
MKPTTEIILALMVLMVRSDRLATAVMSVCRDEFVDIPCPLPASSAQNTWKYSSGIGRHWQNIASFSKNEAELSSNLSLKFKDVMNVFSNGSLTMSSFHPGLNGIYTCSDEKERVIHIVVTVNCGKKVCEGDDSVIECDLLQYRKLILNDELRELDWKQQDQTIVVATGPSGMSLTYHNIKYDKINLSQNVEGALMVKSVDKSMDGQRFTCILHGQTGITPRRSWVTLEVMNCEQNKEACEMDSVAFKCPYRYLLTTDLDTEATKLVWFNGSRKIVTFSKDHGHVIHSNSSLINVSDSDGLVTLRSITIFDSGVYRCNVVRKGVVIAEHSVTLNVTPCAHITQRHDKEQRKAKDVKEILAIILPIISVAVVVFLIIHCVKPFIFQPAHPPPANV